MTVKQRKALQRYIDQLRPMLGLSDWRVDVLVDPLGEDEDALACVDQLYGSKTAMVEVRSDYFEAKPEYQREVAIHELLHCVFAAPQRLVFIELGEYMPRTMHKVFEDTWRMNQEYAIDGLAAAIAPRFPLPKLP